MAPEAFAATVFVEPIIFQLPGQTQNIAKQALKRRDRWGSYAEAKTAFMKSRGMSDWHSEQLQKYVVSLQTTNRLNVEADAARWLGYSNIRS